MANKPLQSIKFPDLPDTYTIPVVDSTLAVSGAAADAKETGDGLADKVDKEPGKGLSTNDYTDEEKTKLADIETGATKTTIDSTLTVTGNAADAKAVGDAIANEDKKALAAFATDTASGAIANFTDGADSIPMKDVLVHIEPVQEGSGDPSPDNVRPITGWTGAKVTRTGVNVWDEEWELGGYSTDTGVKVADSTRIRSTNATSCKPNTRYFNSASNTLIVLFYDNNNEYLSYYGVLAATSFVTPASCYFMRFYAATAYGATYNNDISINYPETDTSYHAYTGDFLSITFPSEAGTVYGGTLDVTSGVLTVDSIVRDMGSGKWGYNSTYNMFIDNGVQMKSYGEWICEIYPYKGIHSAMPDKSCGYIFTTQLAVKDSSFNGDADAFKSAMNGIKAVTPLATPITYTLTPQEITSLLGVNNVWADTGDSEVEYRADTKMYITKKITEAVSALS